MKQVAADSLLDCSFETREGTIGAEAVLPFFTDELEVTLLLVLSGQETYFTRDRPTGVVGRVLACAKPPKLKKLAHLQPTSFKRLHHFDPWWLFEEERKGVVSAMRKAIVQTNLAGRDLIGVAPLDMLHFDAGLARVTTGVARGRGISARRLREALVPWTSGASSSSR